MIQKPNFSNIQIGQKVALLAPGRVGAAVARTYRILTVTKTTAAQFACGRDRFRKEDGQLIGERYTRAMEATPEILAQAEAEEALEIRYSNAYRRLNSLDGRWISNLKLSISQMEELADSWERVQAMKPAEVPA